MASPFPPPGTKVLSIGELTRDVKSLLEEAHANVWVEGEVSNLARPSSGHVYLTLKDETAPLRAVLYRGIALRLKYDLKDGMRVVAHGQLTVYVPRGDYQLQILEVQPKGIGPLELAFRQLREKLSVKGYFEKARKRPLPRIPRRVVVVTSPTGSAVRDVLEILGRRWPAAEVWVCPVPVQGEGAGEMIARAIHLLNRVRTPIDVLIVGRGGGSLEDLWPFNEEIVADAIYASRIPVVSGVGHEDDLTIADLVADVRALTPSEAAERVVPNQTEVLSWLEGLADRFRVLLLSRLDRAKARLTDLAGRRCFRAPLDRLRDEERRLDEWSERLERAARNRLDRARQRLEALAGRLETLSPLNVLARGYSLTRTEAGRVVIRDPAQVRPGDRLVTELHHGRIRSQVVDVEPNGVTDEPREAVAKRGQTP